MSTHDEVMRLLPRYDTLSPAARAAVDEHVAGCRVCAARLAVFRHIERERAASEGAVRRRTGGEQRRPPLARPLLALGVLALAAVAWLAARGDLLSLPRLETLLRPAPAPIVTPAPTPAPLPTITPEPTVETGAPPDSIAWLRQHASSFRGVEPGDLGDLAPLEKMIGQAQVVVITDPTFGGTHETLAMRQRLLELLVERMGFSVVLAEVPWAVGNQIDTYIRGGAGVPENLLLDTTMPQSQEWLYTVRWLRSHNANPAEKAHVTFAGFLPSSLPPAPAALDAVSAYMYKVEPQAQPGVRSSDQQLVEWLQAHHDLYVARSSEQEYDHALLAAQALAQYEQLKAVSVQQQAFLSAAFKLSNLDVLLGDARNERALIWRATPDPELASTGNDSYLRLRYGSRAVFVTFDFYRGSVFAYPSAWPDDGVPLVPAVHAVPPAPVGSYETWLHAAGMPRLMLDMRPSLDDASLLPALRYTRNLAAGVSDCYPEDNFVKEDLAAYGDLLIFFDQVTPPTFLSKTDAARPVVCSSAPQDLDFARGTEGWYLTDGSSQYEVSAAEGQASITAVASEPGRLSSGVLSQSFRADDYRGKRVRLTVVAGTEAAVAASLWLEADQPAFQNQAHTTQPLPGAFSQTYELNLYVPDDAIRISFGVQLHGQGRVTVRDVRFEVIQ